MTDEQIMEDRKCYEAESVFIYSWLLFILLELKG